MKDPLIHDLENTREKLREHFGADDPIIAALDSKIRLALDPFALAHKKTPSEDSKKVERGENDDEEEQKEEEEDEHMDKKIQMTEKKDEQKEKHKDMHQGKQKDGHDKEENRQEEQVDNHKEEKIHDEKDESAKVVHKSKKAGK